MTLVLFIGADLGVRFLRFGDDDNSGGPSPSLDIEAILSLVEAFASMSYELLVEMSKDSNRLLVNVGMPQWHSCSILMMHLV